MDETTVDELLQMVADEEGYTKEDMKQVVDALRGELVRTVHNLRVLTEKRIESLGLPSVVTEYLLRVKGK